MDDRQYSAGKKGKLAGKPAAVRSARFLAEGKQAIGHIRLAKRTPVLALEAQAGWESGAWLTRFDLVKGRRALICGWRMWIDPKAGSGFIFFFIPGMRSLKWRIGA